MKIIELLIDELEDITGFDAVALVNQPAIEAGFHAFNSPDVDDAIAFQIIKAALKEQFVTKLPGESKDSYLQRCIPTLIKEGYDQDQATAICYDSFNFDETEDIHELVIGDYQTRHYDMCPGASTLYKKIESQEIDTDMGLAIRNAKLQDALFYAEKVAIERDSASFEDVKAAEILAGEIMHLARMMGLEEEHQYVLGHLQAIRDLYQKKNELDVDVAALPNYTNQTSGSYEFESYTDYPESATNAARRALEWKEQHPGNDCGTRVGWTRANQLANRRPISEDTIARMASFKRHQQHKDVPYSEGCGGLMWDAWGGTAGIEWASNKLEEIREGLSQEFNHFDDLPSNTQEKLLERLGEVGFSIKDLEEEYEILDSPKEQFALPTRSSANPDGYTSDTSGNYKILYEYKGPKDSKNRDFCRRLLDLNMLFRKEDIQKMSVTGANSAEFGYYDIFTYKGSFGCRHRWTKKYVYQKKDSPGLLEVAGLLLDQANANIEQATIETFSKYKFATNEDQQIVVGPLMIPDKLIFRVDENNEPYYVYFTKDTIKAIAEKMMRNKMLDKMNLEHDPDSPVDGHMMETWIVEDEMKDKQQVYGFNYPVGTWMGQYRINSKDTWSKVKDGTLTGFSIEGFFADRLVQN
jgi:hypothetical protein